MTARRRCTACGNVTRFDVVATRRTKAFFHYSVGGELTVEEEELLDERVERVTCRWCGAEGDAVQAFVDAPGSPSQARAPSSSVGEAVELGDVTDTGRPVPVEPA